MSRAPFRALPPLVAERPAREPKVREVDVERDRFAGLPADGPRQIVVDVQGGRVLFRPTDRPAALDMIAAYGTIGTTYDRKRKAWLSSFDEMLRHGVMEWPSIRFLAAINGLDLVISEAAGQAMERHRRFIGRQLRPIPRVVWSDDRPAESGEEETVTVFLPGHSRDRVQR